MRISQKGESLVGIVIGITILSVALLGIMNLLFQTQDVVDNFDANRNISILEENAKKIATGLNTSSIAPNESFYIYRNTTNATYDIFTGSSNDLYKYIDENGNLVTNTGSFEGNLYERSFLLERKLSPSGTGSDIITPTITSIIN